MQSPRLGPVPSLKCALLETRSSGPQRAEASGTRWPGLWGVLGPRASKQPTAKPGAGGCHSDPHLRSLRGPGVEVRVTSPFFTSHLLCPLGCPQPESQAPLTWTGVREASFLVFFFLRQPLPAAPESVGMVQNC